MISKPCSKSNINRTIGLPLINRLLNIKESTY